MKIECEISLGELIDKLSILRIKLQKISDPQKLIHIKKEELSLSATLASLNLKDIDYHLNQMIDVNLILWKIEDDIRDKERAGCFDSEFIELARNVYKTNDDRFNRKNIINNTYNSGLFEVKSYKEY